MRRLLFTLLFLTLVFLLTACVERDISTLDIQLNPGIDTVEVNTAHFDAGVTSTLEGRPQRNYVVENNVDITRAGTYTIVYETVYRDYSKQIVRIVNVIDQTPPRIELNSGVDTLRVGETWIDAGVTVSDNSHDPVDVTVSGYVDEQTPGTYIITYTATDASGNVSTRERYVYVVE